MIVLVDYDNISNHSRQKGLSYLVDRTVRLLEFSTLKSEQRVLIRLYGGWYILDKLTRIAQSLATTIQEEFPKPITILEKSETHTVSVNVELAYSLAVNPAKHLWHTYRPRGLQSNLLCSSPDSVGCTDPNCPLTIVYDFFKNNRCPKPTCTIVPENLLQRAEQKLVDTMLTADLIHYSKTGHANLCVVTSDDDLWPGMITALLNGTKVTHIETHSARLTSPFYSQGLGTNYSRKNL